MRDPKSLPQCDLSKSLRLQLLEVIHAGHYLTRLAKTSKRLTPFTAEKCFNNIKYIFGYSKYLNIPLKWILLCMWVFVRCKEAGSAVWTQASISARLEVVLHTSPDWLTLVCPQSASQCSGNMFLSQIAGRRRVFLLHRVIVRVRHLRK